MRLFIFKSEANTRLRAFTDDSSGSRLPGNHAPWHAIGVVRPDGPAPHGLPRAAIEKSIQDNGFQLWRMKADA